MIAPVQPGLGLVVLGILITVALLALGVVAFTLRRASAVRRAVPRFVAAADEVESRSVRLTGATRMRAADAEASTERLRTRLDRADARAIVITERLRDSRIGLAETTDRRAVPLFRWLGRLALVARMVRFQRRVLG